MNTKVVGITFASTMLFATITSGLLLSSSSTHAADDSAVTVTEITVPSSCSMTANVSTPHVADIVNGNRAINIGKTTLSTFCNDPGGFAIYAIGYTNNELGSTDVIASNNTDTIATGNTAPSNNSSWGMKVVNNSSSSFPATITPYFNVATNDGYVAVPSTFTLMASRNSGTAMNSATLLDTTYGAYISPTQPIGEYNGQVLYTMVHPSSAAGPNAETMFEAAFLMQPTPPAKKTVGSNSYYKMQDMTPDICTVMSIGAEGQMVDDRDDKIYWVLKAKDGKCWMTQNLDHDIVTTANFYTPANTDIATNWTASAATIPSTDIDSTTGVISGWQNSASSPVSVDTGDWYWTDTWYSNACDSDPYYCNYLNGHENSKFTTTANSGNGTHGHVGNYYNWTAAIAMNDSTSYSNSTLADVSDSPQTSICPAGWRLPTISSVSAKDEYSNLISYYSPNNLNSDEYLASSPLYVVRGGVIRDGSLGDSGNGGYYWSSTVSSNNNAFRLYSKYNSLQPQNNYRRYDAISVRCVARTGTEPVSVNRAFNDANKTTVSVSGANYYKMQDMTPSICSAIDEGQEAQLADTRDNKLYWILKAKDGNCWMTQNLDHNIVTTDNFYTPQNTDVTATTTMNTATIPTSSIASTGAVNGWVHSATVPSSVDLGDWYSTSTWYNSSDCPSTNMYRACNFLNGYQNGKFAQTQYSNGTHGSVGVSYNWSAAVATNDTTSYVTAGQNAPNSICPAGWRLPRTSTTNEFNNLMLAYNAVTTSDQILFGAPLYFNRVGGVWNASDGNQLRDAGDYGIYWSSTVKDPGYNSYAIKFSSTLVDNNFGFTQNTGRAVRCIAK